MSPHAVNNFVSDLVLMAQAMERLPKVEAERDEWCDRAGEYADKINSLKLDIEQGKAYAASLEQRLHDAEVAKDAAETMFLQADDRTMRAVEFIKAQFGAAGSLIQALEPERAKPPVEETVREETLVHPLDRQGEWHNEEIAISEVKPIAADPTDPISNPAQYFHGEPESPPVDHSGESVGISPPQGQSEPDPIAESTVESFAETSASPVADAHGSTSWAAPAVPDTKPQPYAGLSYQDRPRYVSFHDWIDGGGSSDTYYYPLHKAE